MTLFYTINPFGPSAGRVSCHRNDTLVFCRFHGALIVFLSVCLSCCPLCTMKRGVDLSHHFYTLFPFTCMPHMRMPMTVRIAAFCLLRRDQKKFKIPGPARTKKSLPEIFFLVDLIHASHAFVLDFHARCMAPTTRVGRQASCSSCRVVFSTCTSKKNT